MTLQQLLSFSRHTHRLWSPETLNQESASRPPAQTVAQEAYRGYISKPSPSTIPTGNTSGKRLSSGPLKSYLIPHDYHSNSTIKPINSTQIYPIRIQPSPIKNSHIIHTIFKHLYHAPSSSPHQRCTTIHHKQNQRHQNYPSLPRHSPCRTFRIHKRKKE
jgi:hypothetical protein